MNDTAADSPVYTAGQALEQRIMQDVDAAQLDEFADLLDLKNLAGDSTGYVKTFSGKNLTKGSSVSIDLAPGVRYFNIHIIPEPHYDIPRFVYEGMLMKDTMGPGSQVSMDLFPDTDAVEHVESILRQYAAVGEVYEEARQDDRFQLQPSRLMHMRAFSSPVFFLVLSVPEDNLSAVENYANGYYEAWLDMYRHPNRLTPAEGETRQQRRKHIGDMIVKHDPDRFRVVAVYGEETTQLIEKASMY
jgi:hypothetical protein